MLVTVVPIRSSTDSPNVSMPRRKPRMSESLSAAKTVSARPPAAATWSRSADLRSPNDSIVGSSVSVSTSAEMLSPISLRNASSLRVPRSTASCRRPAATSSSSNPASWRRVPTSVT